MTVTLSNWFCHNPKTLTGRFFVLESDFKSYLLYRRCLKLGLCYLGTSSDRDRQK